MTRTNSIAQLREALSPRSCRRMLLGRFVSLVGDFVTPVALVFAVLGPLHGTTTDVGLVVGASVAATAVALMAGGVLATRHHPVAVMAVADLARFAVQAVACALLVAGAAQVWQLVVLAAARGVAGGIFTPASQAAWPTIVPRERLLAVNATMRLLGSLGIVGGPALAGVLLTVLSPGWVLGVDALTFLLSATMLVLVWRAAGPARRDEPAADEPAAPTGSDRGHRGWREVLGTPWIAAIVLQTTLVHLLVAGPLQTLAPAVADHAYGGATAYALWLTAAGIGTLVGGALLLVVSPARPLLASAATMALLVAAPAALASGLPVSVVFAAFLLAGLVESVTGTLIDTTMQQRLAPDAVARVSACSGVVTLVALPAGTVLAGPVSGVLGVGATLGAMAAAVPLVTLPVLLVPQIRAARPLAGAPGGGRPGAMARPRPDPA
jgi:predicted MFS family arabinose efflux permease